MEEQLKGMLQDLVVFFNNLWISVSDSFNEDPLSIFFVFLFLVGIVGIIGLVGLDLRDKRREEENNLPKQVSRKKTKVVEPRTLLFFSSIFNFLGKMGAAAESSLDTLGNVNKHFLKGTKGAFGKLRLIPEGTRSFIRKMKERMNSSRNFSAAVVGIGIFFVLALSLLVGVIVNGKFPRFNASIFVWAFLVIGVFVCVYLALLLIGVLGKLARIAFLPFAGWLNARAANLKTSVQWEQVEAYITSIEQEKTDKLRSIMPVGFITYFEIVEKDDEVLRTGKVFEGFLLNKKLMTLLINGRGFLFENPQRLLWRQEKATVEDDQGGKKKVSMEYTEKEVFDQVFGKPSGEKFTWRNTKYNLLSSGSAEVVVKGSHSHLRNQTMAPNGSTGEPCEKVDYWLAITDAVSEEEIEKEVLFVEYAKAQWGAHIQILPMYAWIGQEVPQDEIGYIRHVIKKGEYVSQRPEDYNFQDFCLTEGTLQ